MFQEEIAELNKNIESLIEYKNSLINYELFVKEICDFVVKNNIYINPKIFEPNAPIGFIKQNIHAFLLDIKCIDEQKEFELKKKVKEFCLKKK